MRKLVLGIFIFFITITSIHAQEGLRAGLNIGLPLNETSDMSTLNVGIDISLLRYVGEKLSLGGVSGYTHYLANTTNNGLEVNNEDLSFIPVAASARYQFSKVIFGSFDIGYAIAVQGEEGGTYYQTKFGWYGNKMDVFAFYKGISLNTGALVSVGVGFAYKILPAK